MRGTRRFAASALAGALAVWMVERPQMVEVMIYALAAVLVHVLTGKDDR